MVFFLFWSESQWSHQKRHSLEGQTASKNLGATFIGPHNRSRWVWGQNPNFRCLFGMVTTLLSCLFQRLCLGLSRTTRGFDIEPDGYFQARSTMLLVEMLPRSFRACNYCTTREVRVPEPLSDDRKKQKKKKQDAHVALQLKMIPSLRRTSKILSFS